MMNVIDRTVAFFDPVAAVRRTAARATLQAVTNYGYSEGAASRKKKTMKNWRNESASPQSDIDMNLDLMRRRSRSAYYTSPIATSAINTNRDHVIGSGLKLVPKIDYKFIGISREKASDLERDIKFKFNTWANSKNCCITGNNTFYELQQIALMTWLMSGECFAIPMYVDNPDSDIQLTIKLLEGDLIYNPGSSAEFVDIYRINPETNNRIYNGIEISANDRVVAYHVADNYSDRPLASISWERIPAYGELTGLPNVLHVFNAIRPQQYRGIPYLAPVIEDIKQLRRYEDAEIMAAVINGLFSVFITTTNGEPLAFEGLDDSQFSAQTSSGLPLQGERRTDLDLDIGNGNINVLRPGESINVVDGKRPSSNFDSFVQSICMTTGAALDIPNELLLKRFSASYSASRGALLEAWNFFSMNRTWFSDSFNNPIYKRWLHEAVAKGIIDLPGFFDNRYIREAYSRAEWPGPSQGQLDPTKEVAASISKMAAGLSNGEKEAIELNGTDYEENLEQIAAERQTMDRLGIRMKDMNEGGKYETD